jgi:hypothetical protein
VDRRIPEALSTHPRANRQGLATATGFRPPGKGWNTILRLYSPLCSSPALADVVIE